MSDESNLTGKRPWYLDAMEVSKRQKAAREAREAKTHGRDREPAHREQPARAAPTREQVQERAAANRARDSKAQDKERGGR
jgi:hypothetical protein